MSVHIIKPTTALIKKLHFYKVCNKHPAVFLRPSKQPVTNPSNTITHDPPELEHIYIYLDHLQRVT